MNMDQYVIIDELVRISDILHRIENLMEKVIHAAERFSNPNFVKPVNSEDFKKLEPGKFIQFDSVDVLKPVWYVDPELTFGDVVYCGGEVDVEKGDEH